MNERTGRLLSLAAIFAIAFGGSVSAGDPLAVYYEGAQSSERFILDQSDGTPKMRFEGTTEIILLEPVPGPRGDLFLKGGEGGPVIRVSPLGGATLFSKSGGLGRPFGYGGQAQPLIMPPRDKLQAQQAARQLHRRLVEVYNFSVNVDVDWDNISVEGPGPTTLADSIENAGLALENLVQDDVAEVVLKNKLHRVRFVADEQVKLQLSENDLTVFYNSDAGLAGRPSSHQIAAFLNENL